MVVEENGKEPHPADSATPPKEDEEAWRTADPYAFFPSPSENNKARLDHNSFLNNSFVHIW